MDRERLSLYQISVALTGLFRAVRDGELEETVCLWHFGHVTRSENVVFLLPAISFWEGKFVDWYKRLCEHLSPNVCRVVSLSGSQAFFLPTPANELVVLQPVRAWIAGRVLHSF